MAKSERVQHRQKWQKAKFLEKLAKCGHRGRAAKAAGIDRTTPYEWLEKDPEFEKAYNLALKQANEDILEPEALRRAVKGVKKPIFYKGKPIKNDKGNIIYVVEYSDTLLMFLMKANDPEKYRDRHEISGPGNGPININWLEDGNEIQ